jgi:hypothetical protein
MSSVNYEVFLPEVMPYVHDVPSIVAVQAVRNACIEFCEQTRFLQTTLDPMPAIANQAEYDLDADTGYVVVDVIQAWFGDSLLIPKSPDELANIYRATDWRTLKGNPYYMFRERADVLTVVPMPATTEANKIKARVAVAPTRASSTVDADLFERFLEAIAFGARARLYDTPGQTYFDKASAMDYRKRFNDAMAEVRTRVNKGMTRASVRIEFQRWA